jgi:hypothetical protein
VRARKTDSNQAELVKQMRKIGISVFITSGVGDGFPDVVAGLRGNNYLFEIKDPNKCPSARKLTPDEQDFFNTWKGSVHKVETIEDVIKIVNSLNTYYGQTN